jgi:hypothetical protein
MTGSTEDPQADLMRTALEILSAGEANGVDMRLLGGVAIRRRAGGWTIPGAPRVFADIDIVTDRKGKKKAGSVFSELGFRGKEPFNSVNPMRMVFYSDAHPFHVDVFVEEFEMCHRLNFAKRLRVDPVTLPCAELLLTKLQIVHLNSKDVSDVITLLVTQSLREDSDDGINMAVVARVLAADWGFWRTATGNLRRISELSREIPLADADREKLDEQIATLSARIEAEQKSLGWKVRSRVGEKRQWYLEPEEIEHEVGYGVNGHGG